MPKPIHRLNKDKMVSVVRQRLKIGESFLFGCHNKEFWRNVIERDIENCTVEDWDEGLLIRRRG